MRLRDIKTGMLAHILVALILEVKGTVRYFSICDHGAIYIEDKILLGSGASENQTGYSSNLDCYRVVHAPVGWRLRVRKIRQEIMDYRDEVRVFDGGYFATHVKEAPINPLSCKDCPEKFAAMNSTGSAILVWFTTGSNSASKVRSVLVEISARPPSPRCKCPAVIDGGMSCQFIGAWHEQREKSCKLTCKPRKRFVENDIYYHHLQWGSPIKCNVDTGKWRTTFAPLTIRHNAFCQDVTLPKGFQQKISFFYQNISCKSLNLDGLTNKLETLIITKTELAEFGTCFNVTLKEKCFVQHLNLSCFEENNVTLINVLIKDNTASAAMGLSSFEEQEKSLKALYYGSRSGHFKGFHLLWRLLSQNFDELEVTVNSVNYSASINASGLEGQQYSIGICNNASDVYVNNVGFYCTKCPNGYQHGYSGFGIFECSECNNDSSCFNSQGPTLTYENCNTSCPFGMGYNNSLGFCDWCPGNYYQEYNVTFAKCTPCPGGALTPYVGAKNATECIHPCGNGTYLYVDKYKPGVCVDCPVNTYMDVEMHGKRQCKACSIGKMTLVTGSVRKEDCIDICVSGKFLNTTTLSCQVCPKGTFQEANGKTACIPCTGGKITLNNATNSSSGCLVACAMGSYMAVTGFQQGHCVPCPVGTYMDQYKHDFRECKPCGLGNMTLRNGTSSGGDCLPKCQPGRFLDTTKKICLPCPKNYFQDRDGQLSCHQCPDSHITLRNGSDNSSQCIRTCPKGSIVVNQGLPLNCSKCPQGKYQDILGATHCKICPKGQGTLYTGSQNASFCVLPCSYGTYQDDSNPGHCKKCTFGSYQDKNTSFEITCTRCPDPKTTTFYLGARNMSECVGFCSSSPCYHGARCENRNGTFACQCTRGLGGKQCQKVLDGEVAENLTVSLKFISLAWQESLANSNSAEFQDTARRIESAIREATKNDPNFRTAKVKELKEGSVVATVDITSVAENVTIQPLETLDKAVRTGQLGELSVQNDSLNLLTYSCGQPLGMEDMRIADHQINASSFKDYNGTRPWDARLRPADGFSLMAWEPSVTNQDQHLQVDFLSPVQITAVATQGKKFTRYIKSYTLAFSLNGTTWTTYKDTAGNMKIFNGNTDYYSVVKTTLHTPRIARFIRLQPVSWNHDIALKMEIYGCIPPSIPNMPTSKPPIDASSPMMSSSVTSPSSPVTPSDTVPSPAGPEVMSGATIAGIVVAVLLVVTVVVLVSLFCFKRNRGSGERKAVVCPSDGEPADFLNPTYDGLHSDDSDVFTTKL